MANEVSRVACQVSSLGLTRRFRSLNRWPALIGLLFALFLSGCATSTKQIAAARPFVFERDTLAYANELVWEYYFDEHGKWTHRERQPKPDYTHHCFVVARSALQFFRNARFDPSQPIADAPTYRGLIRNVEGVSARQDLPESEKITIPGYASLRQFSRAQAPLLKAESGSFWQSYFQRGHWRMIWPFSRHGQEKMSRQLVDSLKRNQAPVVHVVCFPSLRINHALLIFHTKETEKTIEFATYDPNAPEKPTTLTYSRASRTFTFPTNFYFPGGKVDVYEIYTNWRY